MVEVKCIDTCIAVLDIGYKIDKSYNSLNLNKNMPKRQMILCLK